MKSTFSLIVTFHLTKIENRTKKSLRQVSHYFSSPQNEPLKSPPRSELLVRQLVYTMFISNNTILRIVAPVVKGKLAKTSKNL